MLQSNYTVRVYREPSGKVGLYIRKFYCKIPGRILFATSKNLASSNLPKLHYYYTHHRPNTKFKKIININSSEFGEIYINYYYYCGIIIIMNNNRHFIYLSTRTVHHRLAITTWLTVTLSLHCPFLLVISSL